MILELLIVYFQFVLKRDTYHFRCFFVVDVSEEVEGKIGVIERKQNKKLSHKLQKTKNLRSVLFRSVHSVLIIDYLHI